LFFQIYYEEFSDASERLWNQLDALEVRLDEHQSVYAMMKQDPGFTAAAIRRHGINGLAIEKFFNNLGHFQWKLDRITYLMRICRLRRSHVEQLIASGSIN
jgi:hypothetical protein